MGTKLNAYLAASKAADTAEDAALRAAFAAENERDGQPAGAHPSGDDRLLRECPHCSAPPDQWCLTAGGNLAEHLHEARKEP
jgi:hypothetical protein